MAVRSQLLGQRFGRLVVISDLGSYKGNSRWLTQCDCGKQVPHTAGELKCGAVQSCGCLLSDWIRATKRLRPFESLYNTLKSRCRKSKKLKCDLTYEEFLEFTKQKTCHYCGEPVQWTEFNVNLNGQGCNLDRRDSHLAYSKDNCIVCCFTCNTMKTDLPYDVFIAQVRRIATWMTS